MNFSCIRRRVVAAEGEGYQKQEAQSVNPSFGPIEANYFGEEGHPRQEAQSVNSPVESCVWRFNECMNSDLFSVFRDSLVHPVAETKFASAKVDPIQHLYLRSEVRVATLGSRHPAKSNEIQVNNEVGKDEYDPSVERLRDRLLKKFEGVESRMWSAAEVALSARRDGDQEG